MNSVDYQSITTTQALPEFSTHSMFDPTALQPSASPIDAFIADTNELNLLYLRYADPALGNMPRSLSSIVLLGYMSAVESFLRAVVRRMVLIDDVAAKKAEPLTLQFGAALHHARELMPEALLEGHSFAGRTGVEEVFKTVLGITGLSGEVKRALDRYSRICEIRHCCVHRFGRLGSRNAIKLGLGDHSTLLEHPFMPTVDDLQLIADVLRTFVKTLNNFLFATALDRTVLKGGFTAPSTSFVWEWAWRTDKRRFNAYYQIFASKADSPPSANAREAYDSFVSGSGPGGTRWT
ncbi:MAG: Uncharacterized protein JWL66_888 [Sphingomonadales bacterium]|nr:Uncharacterized protein [Sphingomonadales bacterium]